MFKLYCKVTSLWVKNNLVRLLGSTIVLFKNCLGQLGQQQSCDRLNGSTIVTFQNCLGQQHSVPAFLGQQQSVTDLFGSKTVCCRFVWDNKCLVTPLFGTTTVLFGSTTILLQPCMVQQQSCYSLIWLTIVLLHPCLGQEEFYFWCVLHFIFGVC